MSWNSEMKSSRNAGRILELDARDLATTAWGLAKLGQVDVFDAIAIQVSRHITEFPAHDLCTIVESFSTARIADSGLFNAIADELRIEQLHHRSLGTLARAFATACVPALGLFRALADVETTISGPESLVELLFAFACVGWTDRDFFITGATALSSKLDVLDNSALADLYLVALYINVEFGHLEPRWLSPINPMLKEAFATTSKEATFEEREDISTLLTDLGWPHVVDHRNDDGFVIDLAEPATRRAIQIDGPHRYLRAGAGTYILDGPTQFKTRLLQARGWTVAHIPFFEWHDTSDKRQLLQSKLDCIIDPSSESESSSCVEASSNPQEGPPVWPAEEGLVSFSKFWAAFSAFLVLSDLDVLATPDPTDVPTAFAATIMPHLDAAAFLRQSKKAWALLRRSVEAVPAAVAVVDETPLDFPKAIAALRSHAFTIQPIVTPTKKGRRSCWPPEDEPDSDPPCTVQEPGDTTSPPPPPLKKRSSRPNRCATPPRFVLEPSLKLLHDAL